MSAGSKFQNVSPYSKTQGMEFEADNYGRMVVRVGAVSSGAEIAMHSLFTISSATCVISAVAAGTKTLLPALGATTSVYIKGFSLYNEGANARRFQLRLGTTCVWYGGLASTGAFNWNLIDSSIVTTNKPVILYINGAGTAVATMLYKKV